MAQWENACEERIATELPSRPYASLISDRIEGAEIFIRPSLDSGGVGQRGLLCLVRSLTFQNKPRNLDAIAEPFLVENVANMILNRADAYSQCRSNFLIAQAM